MQRRDALKLLGAGACLRAADASSVRPNILFVISDDLNNDFGGIRHLAEVHAPNLDRLARRGVRFENAYCQYPLCNPSRVSLLSGLYPTTTEVLDNITPPRYAIRDFVTLPQYLRRNGYQAGYAGKVFHLLDPASWEDHPSPPVTEKDKHFNFWMQPVGPENANVASMLRGMMQPKTAEPETLEDYRIASGAIRMMNEFHRANEPFFLAVGFRRPHVPFIAPEAAYARYAPAEVRLPDDFRPRPGWKGVPEDAFRPNLDLFFERAADQAKSQQMIAAYYGCVSFMDSQLGRLLDELKRLGLEGNTIVVMIADHGWHLGQKGMWAKMTLFENSAGVPLLICDPRKKTGGARTKAVVGSIDIYPTLAELCGLPPPKALEGRSLARLLDDPQAAWDRPAFTVMRRNGFLAKSVRTAHWRYTEWDEGRRGAELYNHEVDAHELRNLASDRRYASVVATMKTSLRRLPRT
ncbi:MAG: sulfatase [Bryobacteraceae bacterium]